MSQFDLIATCAFGLEAIVKRELQSLGYEPKTARPGRVLFRGDQTAICRANLHLRCAERVLICLGVFPANDFGELFDQTNALPWHEWIPADGKLPVTGKSIQSQLSSVPACQRMVKKSIVEQLRKGHGVVDLEETGPLYSVEVALLKNEAMLTIDTTGDGLHKRGYRPLTGAAPLRETLAAALIMLSFWKAERPLIDPFCGTGTIPIEAALIGRNIAPGLHRNFVAETWRDSAPDDWQKMREQAQDEVLPNLSERIVATDIDGAALKLARQHADKAGVEADIHFQQRPFIELTSKREYGCVICNPPYGHRISDPREVEDLYKSMPSVLRRLPTWSHYILTAYPQFERILGQRADRRRKLYNGRIECQYYQFHGPKPRTQADSSVREESAPVHSVESATPADPEASKPAFGGLHDSAERQATEFRNRLAKRARHLRRWPGRGITCYRLYELDVPGVPLVVDRYEDRLHIAEVNRPHERTPAEHADWLDLMKKTAAEVMEIHPSKVFMKFRDRQRGLSQYEKRGSDGETLVVEEGGLKFQVNLSDYLDTGLFLDHRITRGMFRDAANGKHVLNLFGYTGSFTVYAADGGARSTLTVDSSKTYLDWARENLRLNGFDLPQHQTVRADVIDWLKDLDASTSFDLAIVDPPTFSNSKDFERDWDVQRDHVELLTAVAEHTSPGGVVFFSTNFRRFKLAEDQLGMFDIREISKQTVPPDFRNQRIHRCWRLIAGGS